MAAILTVSADMADAASILVILGATASGKSSLAMAVAREIGAEILSVDSMQVYRWMNIGTAKPSAEEMREVRHHLIDVADPNENFAVSRFVELAETIISDAKTRKVPLIATGGTPLYYKALFEGLFEGPGADESLRNELNQRPLDELHAKLTQVDPEASQRIHVNDRRRLVRALEVHQLTGKPISSFQTAWTSGEMRHSATWFGLNWEKEALNRRINARVKQMLEQGWMEETKKLLDQYKTLSTTAAEATGYKELIAHFQGQLNYEEAIERIKISTRQLARRQMKWFRRFGLVKWLDGSSDPETLLKSVLDSL